MMVIFNGSVEYYEPRRLELVSSPEIAQELLCSGVELESHTRAINR